VSKRYHVKFVDTAGKTYYGIYHEPIPDEEAPKPGHAFITDAVLPKGYEVAEHAIVDLPLEPPAPFGQEPTNEYDKHVYDEIKKAEKLSDSLPDGVHVGSLFQISVADGYAHYVVTKVNKKTCKVEWRGFGGDRYTDHHFEWGGTFSLMEVTKHVRRAQALKKLFSKG